MLILSAHFTQPKIKRFCVLLTQSLQPIRSDLNTPKRKPDLLLFQKVVAFVHRVELELGKEGITTMFQLQWFPTTF
jgi:hypothetical protein